MASSEEKKPTSLWQLYTAFFRIGILTFGGGLAMLPMFRRECVERYHWVEDDELLVIIRGQNLLKLNKFDYTRHPMSKELVPVTIQEYNPYSSYVAPPSNQKPSQKKKRDKLDPTQVVQ